MQHPNLDETAKPTYVDGGEALYIPEEELKRIPPTFRMGRYAHTEIANIKDFIFSVEKPTGFSRADFCAFNLALVQTLSNQSHQYGNTISFSGRSVTQAKGRSETECLGDIKASISDICRYGYGQDTPPTTRQRKAITSILGYLDKTFVPYRYRGEEEPKKRRALAIMGEPYNDKYGSKTYEIHLAPFYCENVLRNFGELPQDIMKRIRDNTDRVTEAHILLACELGIEQQKGSTLIRFIDETKNGLVDKIGLLDGYKKDKSRTEKQLLSLFDTMQNAKVITGYKVDYTTLRGKKRMNKVSFQIATRKQMLEAQKETKGVVTNAEKGSNKCGKG